MENNSKNPDKYSPIHLLPRSRIVSIPEITNMEYVKRKFAQKGQEKLT